MRWIKVSRCSSSFEKILRLAPDMYLTIFGHNRCIQKIRDKNAELWQVVSGKYILIRRLMGSTDQADPSFFSTLEFHEY